jgi:hypothetical protein
MEYKKQVDKTHYSFERYFHKVRWMSYWYQLKEIVSRPEIKTVLDIGPGTDFLRSNLKIFRPDITYHSLDLAADIEPDVFGSVLKIPLRDKSYDLVSAFQVLEHIEFKDFTVALTEMKRVSKQYVFISLPHAGSSFRLQMKVPIIPQIQIAIRVPLPKKHVFNGEHYWEIGKKGYSPDKIKGLLKAQLTVVDEYVPFENQYHHFYLGKVK